MEVQDIMEDFMLEDQERPEDCEESEAKRKRADKSRVKRCPTLELFKLENELDRIVEYDHEES